MPVRDHIIHSRMEKLLGELNSGINYLYNDLCPYSKHIILNQMRCRLQEFRFICGLLFNDMPQDSMEELRQMPPVLPSTRVFTKEELAGYDGKNGAPAYVAVNGTVYDVTDNSTWAAATHFGLSAGRDLTNEFRSCHAGQPVLSRLIPVGTLVQ